MATMLGYEGSIWLVAVLLVLAAGLGAALYAAVRADNRRTPIRGRGTTR